MKQNNPMMITSSKNRFFHFFAGIFVIAMHFGVLSIALKLTTNSQPLSILQDNLVAISFLGSNTQTITEQSKPQVPQETIKQNVKTPLTEQKISHHHESHEKSHRKYKENPLTVNQNNEVKAAQPETQSTSAINSQADTPSTETKAESAVQLTVMAGTHCPRPQYPKSSIRNSEQGVVTLSFLIDLEGQVIQSNVEKTSGFQRLDVAARDALSKCRFNPKIVDGRPQQAWSHIRYAWRIE